METNLIRGRLGELIQNGGKEKRSGQRGISKGEGFGDFEGNILKPYGQGERGRE